MFHLHPIKLYTNSRQNPSIFNHTDMWDAIVLAGKHPLLPFNLFQNLQRTYAWMKYYNSEIEARNKGSNIDEKVFEELFQDVRTQINGSMALLRVESK